jgi:hypothetical protein
MKTKSEILESHIHPTKFLSSLSTETGKLAIFEAMDEYAQQIAMEFAKWLDNNGYGYTDEHKVWLKYPESFSTSELFAKFMAEKYNL